MFLHVAAMILLSLPSAESQGNIKIQPEAKKMLVPLGTRVTIHCNLPARMRGKYVAVPWYKEERDRSLRMIYHSASYLEPRGKYSSPRNTSLYGSLAISNVQTNDSGVYYCATPYYPIEICQKTRLIVTTPSRPTFSILAPPVFSEGQVNRSIPLLCLVFDANATWETVSWDIDGETLQVRKDVDTIDENGAFTIWSLKQLPAKTWTQRTAEGCSVQHGRNVAAGVSPSAGNCNLVLYFGAPCIVVLIAILPVVLHFRKHLTRGMVEQPANRVRTRQTSQITGFLVD